MFLVSRDWNPRQKKLASLLSKKSTFSEAIDLCLEMHALLHDFSADSNPSFYRELISDLNEDMIRFRPEKSFSSIAWNLWHITRIEDIVSNILINDSLQILNSEWSRKLKYSITDTGNAFTKDDVDDLDQKINIEELFQYRSAVGTKTQEIIGKLTAEELKRKPSKEQLDRILSEGALTDEEDSIGLLDFWSRKTVSGLLTMPLTRHQVVHINDSFKLKETYRKTYEIRR